MDCDMIFNDDSDKVLATPFSIHFLVICRLAQNSFLLVFLDGVIRPVWTDASAALILLCIHF